MAKKKQDSSVQSKLIHIPSLQQHEIELELVGTSPLMTSSIWGVAERISEQYTGDGIKPPKLSVDEQYELAFYVMPDSPEPPPSAKGKYGIPTSGIKKCVDAAVRTTGIKDNNTIGLIQRSFQIPAERNGLTEITFKKLERDIRMVKQDGKGSTKIPVMRHRPMFHGWRCKVSVTFNPAVLGPEMMVNLFMHAGQYIGLCEMRAQMKQGECGGFSVQTPR